MAGMRPRGIEPAVWLVALGLAAWGFTSWLGWRPRPVLLAVLIAGCYASIWAVGEVGLRVTRVDLSAPRRRVSVRHGRDPRFLRLARLIREETDRQLVSRQVHRTLVRIVDDRLLEHHQIDRATEPERATAVLGPTLSGYIDDAPHSSQLQTRQLHDVLTRIESL